MSFLSKLCRATTPYISGEQPQDKRYIKLNTNESPYSPSPAVKEIIKKSDYSRLRLYPDPNSSKLVNAIAKKYNLSSNNVFVGNGSDEVLALCFPTFFDPKDETVAFADVTYSFYKVWTNIFKIKTIMIEVDADFKVNLQAYKDSAARGCIICNPNAPTGIAINARDIIDLVSACPDKLFIVDEAYGDFANQSVANYVGQYDNLIVIKTFSKSYGLAGIRCGFALGNEELISGLLTIKNCFNSYTVNALTQEIALAAFEDEQYLKSTVDKIVATREDSVIRLRKMGFEVLPSSSNFIFARHCSIPASEIYFQLKAHGVLVRHFIADKIDNFIRITIGTDAEMQILFDQLTSIFFHK